ncbi:hypothetical protein, partial [Streptomyces sp. IBSBF 2390]|uniref:hypothetical protein n=1 Tax=Streptomyces sp. IBSBF 2390 TaxID=2903533 RepID=UPI002FDC0DB8
MNMGNGNDDLDKTVVEQSADAGSTRIINRVAVKVPPFWIENPSIWFAQIEAQFSISGVSTDQTKFDTVVASIDTKILSEVE